MKLCSLGAEMIHAGGPTDMKKLIVALCSFANVPKKLVKKCKVKLLSSKHNNCFIGDACV